MGDRRVVQCFGTKRQPHKADKVCGKQFLWTAQGAGSNFGGQGNQACPNCGNDMIEVVDQLKCPVCNTGYDIKNGIPLLYPDSTAPKHLREEEDLAKMMNRPLLSRKDQFSGLQWKKSKEEIARE